MFDAFYYFFSRRRGSSSGSTAPVIGLLAIDDDILEYLDPLTLDDVEAETNGG